MLVRRIKVFVFRPNLKFGSDGYLVRGIIISITDEKAQRLVRRLRAFLGASADHTLEAKQHAAAIGLTNHVSEVLPQGRLRLKSK